MKIRFPIFWRYILSQYLKVFFLCVVSFIAILMTTRLQDIVNFASLGPSAGTIIQFILLQIPYILPIAIPISCLIASILLFQRLSSSHELTAFRASGISLTAILTPVLIASAYLSIGSFYIVSEAATSSHMTTNLLKAKLRAVNPLHLARNKHLLKLKGVYLDTLGSSKAGERAELVVMAFPDHTKSRINLFVAKNVKASSESFQGKQVTFISNLKGSEDNEFDHLLVENARRTDSEVGDFTDLIHKQSWKMNNDHLTLPLLLAKIKKENSELSVNPNAELRREHSRSLTEVFRRISLALGAFTFTLMGAAFGVHISRGHSRRGVIFVTGLAALYLTSYFLAVGIGHLLTTATLLYLLPHAIIISASLWMLRRAAMGVE